MGRTCSRYGESRGACRVLVEKLQRKKPLETLRHRRENNIKMELREVGWGQGLDRSGLGLGQMAGCSECDNDLRVQLNAVNFLTS